MTIRENFIRAMRRDSPSWVPFEFSLSPSMEEEFKRRTGRADYAAYYRFPIRFVEPNPTAKTADYTRYYGPLPESAAPLNWNPEWGVMGEKGSVEHFQHMLHPMAGFTGVDEMLEYPFPDYGEPYRWEGMAARVEAIKGRDLVAVAPMQMTLFEISWYLRGMDRFMMDMLCDDGFAEALLDRVAALRVQMAGEYAKAGCDVLMLGDDVATQSAMMIGPRLWRRLIKPRLAEVVRTAKTVKPDLLVFYHGDGNMQAILPDLVEIGVDILNPVQPECMDPVEIKKLYGDRLSFWGALGTQTTLPFGTPHDVRATCTELIEKVGEGGGLLLAPTHVVEPDVPFENLLAFIDTVEEFGQYS